MVKKGDIKLGDITVRYDTDTNYMTITFKSKNGEDLVLFEGSQTVNGYNGILNLYHNDENVSTYKGDLNTEHKKHGEGILKDRNITHIGQWKDDKRHGPGKEYNNHFSG